MAVKIPQVVGNLPSPPNPAYRSTFNTLAYPWSEALTPWTNEMNQLAADTYENAQSAQSDASSASSNAGLAAGYASSASTDAGLALGYKDAAYGSQQAAAGSASTASTASGQAQTARDLARQWASDTTVVADGLKGARGYAQDAAQSAADAASIVLGEVFDNTQESAVKGWTSSKIVAWFNGLTTTFTRMLLGRTNAAQVRTDLELGYAATAPTVGAGAEVMRAGAGGWLGLGSHTAEVWGYPTSIGDPLNLTRVSGSASADNGVSGYSPTFHFAVDSTWGRIRVSPFIPKIWVQGGISTDGTGWTEELHHTGNILTTTGQSTRYPMTQKAVTDALNTKVGLSDNQTIAGVKTFSSFPVTPSAAPTANYQAANKKYVDDISIGVGQTWQDLTSSRVQGTTYTNTTGRSIQLCITCVPKGILFYIGSHYMTLGENFMGTVVVSVIIPPGETYKMGSEPITGGYVWLELR